MLMVSIQVKEPGLVFGFSVRKVLCRSLQKIWLWTELGCNSELRVSVRSSQRTKGVIVDSNREGEGSGEVRVTSMMKVKCHILATGIGLALVVR